MKAADIDSEDYGRDEAMIADALVCIAKSLESIEAMMREDRETR